MSIYNFTIPYCLLYTTRVSLTSREKQMAQQVLEKRLNLESMRRRGDLDPEEELATGSSGSSTVVPGMSHSLATTTTVNIHKGPGWSACGTHGSASVSSNSGAAPAGRTNNTNPGISSLPSSNMVISNTNATASAAITNGQGKHKNRSTGTSSSVVSSTHTTNAYGGSNASSTHRSTSDHSIVTNNSGNSMLTNGSGPSSSVNSLDRGVASSSLGNSRSIGACFCFFRLPSVRLVLCFVCLCQCMYRSNDGNHSSYFLL